MWFGTIKLAAEKHSLGRKLAETNFQTDKEKTLMAVKTFVVLTYHRAPFVSHLDHVHGTDFQVEYRTWDGFASSVGAIDG